jgi:hypothetical protein
MKITKKVAAAALVPAAVTGITLSSLAVVHAATGHSASHAVDSQALQARVRSAGAAVHHGARTQVRHASGSAATRHRTGSKAQNRPAARPAPATAEHRAHAQAAPAARPVAARPTSIFTGMSAFERCVAWRESGDNPTASSAGLFGILPATWASLGYSGTAGQAPVAVQKAAFNRLYAEDGTQPWGAYDGC